MSKCIIKTAHCEACGSTDPENIANLADTDGYTRCCNELVADNDRTCRNHHNES